MNKDYVQEYAGLEKSHWWFIVRQQILTSLLSKHLPQQKLMILNIGAAGGASSRWLATFGEVVSLETDPFFTDHLLQQEINVINASVTNMPFADQSFDVVCAFDVIEHVQEDWLAIDEIERVCKTDGFICLTVPSFQGLWSQHDVVNGHFRRYTKASLIPLVNRFTSLTQLELKYFNSLLFFPIWVARKYANTVRSQKKEESDFKGFKTGSISNRILKAVFSLELKLLQSVNFPVGVSLFGIWKKV